MNGNRRQPFWLPASNYYVLAVALAAAFFFLLWGILHDAEIEMPWVTAGVSSSIFLVGAVVMRVIMLHRARALSRQPVLGESSGRTSARRERLEDNGKLTIELNGQILGEIQQRSAAANVLDTLAAGHLEVAKLCKQYIERNDRELKDVKANSPRLAPLLKGRSAASKLHKHHLLRWAELESQSLTNEARSRSDSDERIVAATGALTVIDTALEAYPAESRLIESRHVLNELVLQVRVANLIEKAERTERDGDVSRALVLYTEALGHLQHDDLGSSVRQGAADRISIEIQRLRSISNER